MKWKEVECADGSGCQVRLIEKLCFVLTKSCAHLTIYRIYRLELLLILRQDILTNLKNSFIFASQFNFSLVAFPSGADLSLHRFSSICIRFSCSSRPDPTDDHGRKSSTVKLSGCRHREDIGFALKTKLITKISRNWRIFYSKPDDFPRLTCRKTDSRRYQFAILLRSQCIIYVHRPTTSEGVK